MNVTNWLFSLFATPTIYSSYGVASATPGKRYNLFTDKNSDHFAALPDFSFEQANGKTISFDKNDFTSVTLTDDQAQTLSAAVTSNGGIFAADQMISLPPVTYTPITAVNAQKKLTNAPTSTPTTPIITGIPKYSGTLYGQDVAFMDSYPFPNIAMLQGFTVQIISSSVGNTPCIAHGTNVAEVIAQMFNPTKTDVRFLFFAVFDCDTGQAAISDIAYAVSAIIAYKKGPGKDRGLTVNFSAATSANPAINQLMKQLTDQGITVAVAAGNSQEPCNLISPASAASSIPIQSVGGTQDQGMYPDSDYATATEHCVDIYLPACVPMSNPWTGVPTIGCGTSFSGPIETGRNLVYKQQHPKATPAKIKKAMHANSVTFTDPNAPSGAVLNSITPAMAFSWPTKKHPTKNLRTLVQSPEDPVANADINEKNGNLRATARPTMA